MITTQVESLWLFALASKCKSLTPPNAIIFLSILLLSYLILNLIFWAHPAGPAWGRKLKPTSIPGPKGLPFIGSLNLMMSGLPHRNLASAAQSFAANRLMAFSLGETRAVVTCHPEVAKQILNSSAFVDRPAKESAYELMFSRSIGFAPYGVYWTTLRRIAAAHLFSPKQMRDSENQRVEIANEMVAFLNSRERNDVRVREMLQLASLGNMMRSVFGRECGVGCADDETAEVRDLVGEGYRLLGRLNWSDHFGFLAEFDAQKIRFRCNRLVPRVNRFIGGIVAEHKARMGDPVKRDFVDVLLSLQGPDRLSDSDMISVLWEMIFRGTDTVAVLMEWILARLVLHPDVQSKVHDELDKVVGKSRAVSESDLPELVYLTAVVKEVLRMHPPGPLLSWARLSIRDTNVDGHHVPAGTTAMVNMWAISRDPDNWPDPARFKPERFLGHDPEFSVLGSDLRLAPFGSGRRSCPGKTMGLTAVSYWVATLLHEFELVGGAKSVDLSEAMSLSCEMANPLEVRAQRRRLSTH